MGTSDMYSIRSTGSRSEYGFNLYQTARRHIPKCSTLRSHRCVDVKSKYVWFVRSGDSDTGGYLLGCNTVWPIGIQSTFRRNMWTPSSGSKNTPSKKLAELGTCFVLAYDWFIIRLWCWKQRVPPKRQLTSNGLHGVCIPKYRTLQDGFFAPLLRSIEYWYWILIFI
jgi:hypothetical protein